jgi:hypothetical protein
MGMTDAKIDQSIVLNSIQIAKRQKILLLLMIPYIAFAASAGSLPKETQNIAGIAAILFMVLVAFCIGRVASLLHGKTTAILLSIISLLPIIGLIVLYKTNSQATKYLQNYGFPVGLFGGKVEQIKKMI